MGLLFDTGIPLLGLYSKNPEIPIPKNICTPVFPAALFSTAKFWKQPKCPSVDERIKKMRYICTKEYYADKKRKRKKERKRNLTLYNCMDGHGDYDAM